MAIVNINTQGYFKIKLKANIELQRSVLAKEYYEDTTVVIEPKI